MNQLKSFLTGVQFLTRLPCPNFKFENKFFVQALFYFPLVGLLVGLILTGVHFSTVQLLGPQVTSTVLIFTYVLVTGGLHLDGLMDTVDGIFSHRAKERILEIMKDSRVGAHGVTVAIVVLLLKFSIYQSLDSTISYAALLQVFILSRWTMVPLIHFFPYIRSEGLGKMYKEESTSKQCWGASILTLLLVLFLGWKQGLLLFIIISVATWLYGRKISQVLGGLTGDTYGAYTELAEVTGMLIVLLSANVL